MFTKIRQSIRTFADDQLAFQRELIATNAAIVGELQALKADRSEQLERIAVAVESLAEMQRAILAQSHPHLVR